MLHIGRTPTLHIGRQIYAPWDFAEILGYLTNVHYDGSISRGRRDIILRYLAAKFYVSTYAPSNFSYDVFLQILNFSGSL